jgi:hypothetical protein
VCSAKPERARRCYRCKGSGKIKIDVMGACQLKLCAPLHRHYVYKCKNASCMEASSEQECCHCAGSGYVD